MEHMVEPAVNDRWQLPAIIATVILVIFGGYELLERFGLPGAEMETLHRLHILRGISATLVGTFAAAWWLNRRTQRLFSQDIGVLVGSEGIGEQIAWFLSMRWIVAAVTTAAIFVSQHVLRLLPDAVTPYLWMGCMALWLTSLVFHWTKNEFGNFRSCMLWLILTDLVILTHLLHFSGGLENPLFVIYIFHVIIAGILLPKRDAYLVSALIAAFFLFAAFGEYFRLLPHYTLAIFPHEGHGAQAAHASHQLPFVLGTTGTFLILLGGSTFFTTTIMERLRASNQRLLQAEKFGALGQLVAYIAHEVNNPIGIISTRMKLARSGADEYASPEFLKETLEIVDRQADRVGNVVRSLLSLSKPHLQPKSPTDFNDVLSEALYILSGRVSRAGIIMEETLAEDLPKIESRRNDLLHVFLNILNNAIDAMPRGGALKVESHLADGWISASIADTGPGISEEFLDKIFDPFYTTKSHEQGTGLGLSISLALVRSLGGEIKVESARGKGSCFRVRFPWRTAIKP